MSNPLPIAILGSGPAGCTAALYACRAGLFPTLFAGEEPGGQLTLTTEVENWPGGPPDLTGPRLVQAMEDQLVRMQIPILYQNVSALDLSKRPFRLRSLDQVYQAETIILATGARARTLDLPSVRTYWGKGVSACATCDGFFYRNQTVAVIGGGNTALEEALYLANLAQQVHLIHRRSRFRAEHALKIRVFEREREGRIKIHYARQLAEIGGDGLKVTHLRLRPSQVEPPDPHRARSEEQIPLAGCFIAIGHDPCTPWLKGQLQLDDHGFIQVDRHHPSFSTATSVPGVFAAGDVADPRYRQAITAAAMGCQAALDAKTFLETQK